jgi:hypothetical protein
MPLNQRVRQIGGKPRVLSRVGVLCSGQSVLSTPYPSTRKGPARMFRIVSKELRVGVFAGLAAFAPLLPPAGAFPGRPVVSQEHPPTDPFIAPADQNQVDPDIASNGSLSLVAWSDRRGGSSYDIYSARVDASGTILDAVGVPIARSAGDQSGVSVTSDGIDFLVVWEDFRSGTGSDIYAARVTEAGEVLDPEGFPVSALPSNEERPAVTWNGMHYVVAFGDRRFDTKDDIFAARVTTGGEVIDPAGFPISRAPNNQGEPDLAWDGTNVLLVWQDHRAGGAADIFGARVTSEGMVLDAAGFPISIHPEEEAHPTVDWGGSAYLTAWERDDSNKIRGAVVGPNGSVLVSDFPIGTRAAFSSPPRAAFDGTNFFVAWRSDDLFGLNIHGARVAPDGTVLDPEEIVVSEDLEDESDPSVAWDGSTYIVVWAASDPAAAGWDVYGSRVDADGDVVQTDLLISTAAAAQINPAVAWNGQLYLTAWVELRGTHEDIYAARVSGDGSMLDPQGIAIATDMLQPFFVDIASDGTGFLVVWETDFDGTLGARVTADGQVLDAGGFLIGRPPNSGAAVEWGGGVYLVGWNGPGVHAARVTPEGNVLDPGGIEVAEEGAEPSGEPVIAWNGRDFLIGWKDYAGPAPSKGVLVARVSPRGTVRDPDGVSVSGELEYGTDVAVAAGTNVFLVVWHARQQEPPEGVRAARVGFDGSVLDPGGFPVSLASVPGLAVSVAWFDAAFLVTWGGSFGVEPDEGDVLAAAVKPDGEVRFHRGLRIAATDDWEIRPDAVAGPDGRVAVAYTRQASGAPYGGVNRTFVRFVDSS